MTTGVLEVLNVGSGHLKVEIDPANPGDLARAKRMVTDMLSRGYAIFVEVGGHLRPVRAFDPKRAVYLIDDVPGVEEMAREHPPGTSPERTSPAKATCKRCHRPAHRGRCKRHEVPMASAKATSVGRTAGG